LKTESTLPRRAWVVITFLTCCCACSSVSPDESSWKALDKADGRETYSYQVADHLKMFWPTGCAHVEIAAEVLFKQCSHAPVSTASLDACSAYLAYLPSGDHITAIEPLIWWGCNQTNQDLESRKVLACTTYLKTYPNGANLAAVKRIVEQELTRKRMEARAADSQHEREERIRAAEQATELKAATAARIKEEQANAAREAAILRAWNGPLVELEVRMPFELEETHFSDLQFKAAGKDARLHHSAGPKLNVPSGYPVEVCLKTDCTIVSPVGRELLIPFTRVFLYLPNGFTADCDVKDGEYVMPGPHSIACTFTGSFADHASGSVGRSSTDTPVEVQFVAPDDGGTANVAFESIAGGIRGAFVIGKDGQSRWRLPGHY